MRGTKFSGEIKFFPTQALHKIKMCAMISYRNALTRVQKCKAVVLLDGKKATHPLMMKDGWFA